MSAEHFFLDGPQVYHTKMFEIKLIPPTPKKSHSIFHIPHLRAGDIVPIQTH